MQEFFQQIREQLNRIWENLPTQQKILFVSAPVALLIAMSVAVYLASRPRMVTLVKGDESQLAEITEFLETNNIAYQTPDSNTVTVDEEIKSQARMQLARANLLGTAMEDTYGFLDEINIGLTERMFTAQNKRSLEQHLRNMIMEGDESISNAYVTLSLPEWTLFSRDQAEPSANVKLITRGAPSPDSVQGIQNLMAFAVPKLRPENVAVLDKTNKLLSEDSADPRARQLAKQMEIQRALESDLQAKLANKLDPIVGPENYVVTVTISQDWTERNEEQVQIVSEGGAPISDKTYSESTTQAGVAGTPGVAGNTQDSGIGPESPGTETKIDETVTNFQYPWIKSVTKEQLGEIDSMSVSVQIDQTLEDESGNKIPHPADFLTKLEQDLRIAVGLPQVQTAAPNNFQFSLTQYLFDDSAERDIARQQMWENAQRAMRSLLPLVLLMALGYFAYIFFQRAFATPEILPEEMEEEVPIEPVTEAKELSLAQLGLAEFGDIASLPAEEQRRLKMQEHVINYAAEKPEEVAAIIKAWLSG